MWAITWKIIVIAAIVGALALVCKLFHLDFPTWFSIVIGLAGLVGVGISVVKKDLEYIKQNKG